MRKLTRPPAPDFLQINAQTWNTNWVQRREQNPTAKFQWAQFQSQPVNQLLREPLAAMTDEHCAFCDRFTVEPETIEHFKPKSDPRFMNLAYEWTNLYFCCGGCQSSKRERWDDRLLQPDSEDYDFRRYFEFDYTTGQIRPNCMASPDDQARASITIQLYDLDSQKRRRYRRIELEKWRKESTDVNLFAYRDYLEVAMV